MPLESNTSRENTKGNESFFIQPGHVRVKKNQLSKEDDFRDIFPAMFSENDESMYLFWHQIPIRFHYTFDCFASLGNIIDTLELIAENSVGNTQLIFLTETVSGQWSLSWKDEIVTIDSIWTGREEVKLYAEALNSAGKVEMKIESFLAEWKLPLIQVLNAIDTGKGRNLNDSIEVKVEQIGTILQAAESYGIQYQKA